MTRTGAANVGGIQRQIPAAPPPVAPPSVAPPPPLCRRPLRPASQSSTAPASAVSGGAAGAIAAALSSPFGGGPAAFRHGRREGPADTVYLGVFSRSALEEVGGFDESLIRNQDYELNWRLRRAGHLVWLDPELVVDYTPRDNYRDLAAQYFQYGAWKRTMLLRNPGSIQLRQLAPPVLLAALAVSAVELGRRHARGAVVPLLYIAACAQCRPPTPVAAACRSGSFPSRLRLCCGALLMGSGLSGRAHPPSPCRNHGSHAT